jgi:hypothetical protein
MPGAGRLRDLYPCPRADAPPVLDGVLDDPCWDAAPLVSGFTLYDKPVEVEVQTAVRVTYDDASLYFGVACAEPLSQKLAPVKAPRDTHAIFGGEAVEVFVDPKHDHTGYFQFAVSDGSGLWDSRGSDPTWNGAVQTAAAVGDGQWSVELAVPWADLGVTPQPGAVVGFNVCRDRHLGGTREWTNWSQTNANFHDPVRFAHLVLSGTPEQIGGLEEEFRKGERTGPIQIFSSEGVAGQSYRELAKQALARVDAQLAELDAARAGERDLATQAELARLIEGYRAQLAPYRQQVEGVQMLDAAGWTKMNWELNAIAGSLAVAVWEARLSALLSGI